MNLVGISYQQSPIKIREKLVLAKQEQVLLLQRITKKFPISEIFVLSTCNRTELYYYTKQCAKKVIPQDIFFELLKFKQVSIKNLALVEREKEKAYRHFFRVACGMESMVFGETQILKQVKEAMLTAKEHNFFGTQLEFLFQKMFYITKKIRSETKISANAISVGSAVVKLTKNVFDNLSQKKVMIIGAGKISELILQHLIDNEVSDIIITNRTFENALRLAKKFDGSAVLYKDRYKYLGEVDIIISSTHAPDFVIKKSLCQNLLEKKSPIFLIDIAVPRDIEPEIEKLENCYLYHIDDLEKVIFSNYGLRKKEFKKANFILEVEIEYFLQHLNWQKKNFFIKSLKIKYEKMVKKELEFFFSKHLHLQKQESAIEHLVYRIQQKFLHSPYLFLKNKSIKESKEIFCDIFDIPFIEDKEKESTNNIIQFKKNNE